MIPRKPADQKKTNQIVFRMTDSERKVLDQLAAQANCTPSEYIREAVISRKPLLESILMQELQPIIDETIKNMSVKDFKTYKKKLNNQK